MRLRVGNPRCQHVLVEFAPLRYGMETVSGVTFVLDLTLIDCTKNKVCSENFTKLSFFICVAESLGRILISLTLMVIFRVLPIREANL